MSGSNINSPSLSLNVANGGRPSPSKIYSFSVTMASGTVSEVDLRALQNLNILQQVQGMFVDNSANSGTVVISISTGMDLLIPGYSQGFFPVFVAPNAPVFSFTGSGTVTVTLTNFAMPAAVWGTLSLGNVFTGSPLLVRDAALEATINSLTAALNATPLALSSGDVWVPKRVGSLSYYAIVTAATTYNLIVGSPSAFVTGAYAYLTPNATLAAAGNVVVTLGAFSGTILARTMYVPAVAANASIPIFEVDDLSYQPQPADTITLTLSAAFATGGVEVTLFGGTTAIT